jgi:hypothetical protein
MITIGLCKWVMTNTRGVYDNVHDWCGTTMVRLLYESNNVMIKLELKERTTQYIPKYTRKKWFHKSYEGIKPLVQTDIEPWASHNNLRNTNDSPSNAPPTKVSPTCKHVSKNNKKQYNIHNTYEHNSNSKLRTPYFISIPTLQHAIEVWPTQPTLNQWIALGKNMKWTNIHKIHNIIHIHNNVLWNWQCFEEYFHIQIEYGEYSTE